MLPLDDPRWNELLGGYQVPYDPSDALRRLENGEDVWHELWEELHHQGDVGEASYATVPHLVRIAKLLPRRDWNFYGLVSTIEIERHRKSNPPIPSWLAPAYTDAMRGVLELAVNDLPIVDNRDTVRSIVGAIALAKGELELGALISLSDDSEIDEVLNQYNAWSQVYEK
jgi:hypothetical protein